MPRPARSLVTAGALTALAALAATGSAQAATRQQPHPAARAFHHVTVRVESRSHRPAGSVALFGAAHGTFQAVKNITGPKARNTAFFGLYRSDRSPRPSTRSAATTGSSAATTATSCRCTPCARPRGCRSSASTAASFDEGGTDFDFFCDGVAVRGSFALATGDSQGLAQLIRKKGRWKSTAASTPAA